MKLNLSMQECNDSTSFYSPSKIELAFYVHFLLLAGGSVSVLSHKLCRIIYIFNFKRMQKKLVVT